MNYCCAMGNCAACVARRERYRRLRRQRAKYRYPTVRSKQDVLVTVDTKILDEEQYQRMWYLHDRRP